MLFVVRFTDKPESLAIRERFLPAHLQWLEQNRHCVLLAGSLRATPEAPPVGAFWVVEAPSKAAAEAVFATDPFWVHGLRQGVEVLHFSKAFPGIPMPV